MSSYLRKWMRGANMNMDQYIFIPLGLGKNTEIQSHTAHRIFPALLQQFDFLPFTLKILKIPSGDFLFSPDDSLIFPSSEVSFSYLNMKILPNDFSQFSCLTRYYKLKRLSLDCLAHISLTPILHLSWSQSASKLVYGKKRLWEKTRKWAGQETTMGGLLFPRYFVNYTW